MHNTHLRNIDLNLLIALSALLEEQSVSIAAHKIGLSQSAMSRALGRLRKLFDDQLLVRTARTSSLTPKAEAIKPELDLIMKTIGHILVPETFDPQGQPTKFRIAINDYAGSVVLPKLSGYFSQQKHAIDLDILPHNQKTMELLEQGAIDLAIGSFAKVPDSYFNQKLFNDHFVGLVRKGHPILNNTVTMKTYLEQEHLVVSLNMAGGRPVDTVLKARGKVRHVKINMPFFRTAPAILENSDMILTLPNLLANELASTSLEVTPLKFKLPDLTISQIWHPRLNSSAAHEWLRSTIKRLISQ